MVAPVVGPFTRERESKRKRPDSNFMVTVGSTRQTTMKQQRPFTLPLPYTMDSRRIVQQNNWAWTYMSVEDVSLVGLISDAEMQRLYNRAYESFMGNARSAQADVMTLMRERQKSLTMIQNRGLQLAMFVQQARKRNLAGMRAVLKHSYSSTDARYATKVGWRSKASATGGNVLEASWGWAPLAADIASAVAVFRNGPPGNLVKGSAHLVVDRVVKSGWDPYKTDISHEAAGWVLRAQVRCVDSDIYLLNSLGLVNIASSLWETTPWSFAVDYFVNVQSFLNSFTDRLGLDFENASSTSLRVRNSNITFTRNLTPPPDGGFWDYSGQHVVMNRRLGISRPTLSWRSPWSLSPQRALTSIALLLSRLKD